MKQRKAAANLHWHQQMSCAFLNEFYATISQSLVMWAFLDKFITNIYLAL